MSERTREVRGARASARGWPGWPAAGLVLVATLASGSARAEIAAVAWGGPQAETAAARSGEVLAARGFELLGDEAVHAATSGPLSSEPTAGEVESFAAALGADLVVTLFSEVAGEEVTLRLAVFDAATRSTRAASVTTAPDGAPDAVAELLETLVARRASPPASEPAGAEAPEPPAEDAVAADEAPEPVPPPPLVAGASSGRRGPRAGRVQFVLNTTTVGLSTMAGVLFAANVRDPRLFAPILLAGGGGGLATAFILERRWRVSPGDNSMVAAGAYWGGATGLLVAGSSGYDSLRWLMTGFLVGEVLGLGAGVLTAAYTEVSAGDAAVVHSGALWGIFAGSVLATLVSHRDARASYGMILAGLYAGLGAGALSAHLVEISPGRAAIVDLCGLLGVLLGASIGIPIIVDSQSAGHLRAYAGVLLGAAAAGIGLGALLTRRWDDPDPARDARPASARRRRALASLPVPVPVIIEPAEGVRHAGPALGIQLVGGMP